MTHLSGLFLNAQARVEGCVTTVPLATCPCCGTSKSHHIAKRRLDGVELNPDPARWSKTNLFCRMTVGCTRCLIAWDIPLYFPAVVIVNQGTRRSER